MRRQRVYRESGPERHWGHPKTKAFLLSVLCLLFVTLCVPAIADEPGPPTLPLGASAPDFCLPGIDGQTHCLKDYAGSKVLVVAFTCNHCPTAQLYESRIKQLAADYRDRGVALVAIQPNNPNAVRLDEMGYTDVGDSFEEMKLRAAYRHFNFPYLYDGDTQKVSRDYGPSATPHLFIFDAERKLRYQGRVDNNPRESLVTSRDARNAIDAILAERPVPVSKTPSVGCSTKWLYKEEGRKEELAEIERKPIKLQPVSAEELQALRKNLTGKLLLVNFWATWCGPCQQEMPDFQAIYRMYGHRAFELVTVSINYPDERAGVLSALNRLHATSRNLILGSTDIYLLLAAFDADWNAAVPYTALLRPGGEVIYKRQGTINPLEMKRLIISNLVDDDYIGHQAYWQNHSEK
ncbi:MAG: redoxin [Acidobacteria bacterium]|nr:MAG: redoxin [Acidobacteriota bacterium]